MTAKRIIGPGTGVVQSDRRSETLLGGPSVSSAPFYLVKTCPRILPQLYPENPAVTLLNEQIELECKIRDGATKLQQAAKNTWQSMEASKGLFVSNAKILALMKELQQIQHQRDWTVKKSEG